MTKTGDSERTTIPAKERTAKDHAKAVGNGLLGVGEALLGVGIMAGTVALVVVSFGTALLGPGVGDLFAAGASLTADGTNRVGSPYGNKPQQTQPVSQMDEEERRKLEQAKALSRSQTREQTTAIEQGQYAGKSNPAGAKQTQMSVPIAVKGSQVVQSPRPKEFEEMPPPRGMGAELLHKIKKNPWKTLGTALLATAFPAGTVIAGAIAVGVVAKSSYDSYSNKKASQGKADSPTPRGMGAELLHKIKKNPWKTLGTALLATAFPVGTAIAGAVAVGVVAKSGYDAHVNKKASQGKADSPTPRGMGAELLHKIKKNPWKTVGTALLATAFPVGTAIAGAVAVGVVAKSGYDAYVNKKAAATINPSGYSSNPSQPVTHKNLYEPKISPPSTPTRNQTHNKSRSGIQ